MIMEASLPLVDKFESTVLCEVEFRQEEHFWFGLEKVFLFKSPIATTPISKKLRLCVNTQ